MITSLGVMHIFQAAASESFLHLVFIKWSQIYFSCKHLQRALKQCRPFFNPFWRGEIQRVVVYVKIVRPCYGRTLFRRGVVLLVKCRHTVAADLDNPTDSMAQENVPSQLKLSWWPVFHCNVHGHTAVTSHFHSDQLSNDVGKLGKSKVDIW